ncbi:MAG: DUF2779 domain-containing protein [Bacilli bacterium]|nr:DUF2779 domain-containing protein [Bacilli bacterium]
MAITKTDFLEYSKCPRFVALERVNKDHLDADVSYEDYKKREYLMALEELLASMFETDENGELTDHVNVINHQLEAMMDYYKKVEEEAGKLITKMFPGKTIYAKETKNQESFDCSYHGLKFLCYVDIYNEYQGKVNIIEVKATTSKKYVNLQGGYPKQDKYSIFKKEGNIHYLKDEIKDYPLEEEMPRNVYESLKSKLFNRFGIGSYIYDLAVQRFIIEQEYIASHNEIKLQDINYYLAVLNADYIFDGTYECGEALYLTDQNGNELITLFDMNQLTQELQPSILKDADFIYDALKNSNAAPCPLKDYCQYKKQTCCKFFKPICGSSIPKKNSSLNYLHNGQGFKDEEGNKHKGLELINEGYLDLLDIPETWIHNENHRIQRRSYQNNEVYINAEKIKKGIEQLEYPIYHLDFETFPCPVPRFKGERPFTQSPFEFSLHIENSPGNCDFEKDNIIFLAKTSKDEREELIKTLLNAIDPYKGTLFAQNVAFEKGRIKELAECFKEYQKPLMALYERGFDLLWLINNNQKMYENLGFSDDVKTVNYYHKNLSGSYSIKKTLPIFSNLSYENLEVKNGTEAIIEYANYDKMSKEELALKQEALRIYCRQDTWAMVEILNALRILSTERQKITADIV